MFKTWLVHVIILTSIKWRQKIGVKGLTDFWTAKRLYVQTAKAEKGHRAKKSGQSVPREIVQKL